MGVPLGSRCCLGSLRFGIFASEGTVTGSAWRECDRGNVCTKPLYSCGFLITPSMVTMRLRAGQSQWEKADFHNFSGILCQFLRYLPILFCFCWYLALLHRGRQPQTPRLDAPQCSPKSTFFFGARAAAMGVFNASTTGAASLKWRITVSASFGLSASFAGSVALSPHCLHRIRSRAGCSHGNPLGGRVSALPSNSVKFLRIAAVCKTLRNCAWLSSSQCRMAAS